MTLTNVLVFYFCSALGRKAKLETYANLHPIQLLVPAEKVALQKVSALDTYCENRKTVHAQVTVNADGRLRLLIRLEPPFRSKFASVWSPHVLVAANGEIGFRSCISY